MYSSTTLLSKTATGLSSLAKASAPTDARPADNLVIPDRILAERFLYEKALQQWLRESSSQREHEMDLVSRHVEISLNALIDRQQHQLAEYLDRKVEGQTVTGLDGLIAQTEQHIDDLNNRLESRRRELEMERQCAVGDIRQIGRALAVVTGSQCKCDGFCMVCSTSDDPQ